MFLLGLIAFGGIVWSCRAEVSYGKFKHLQNPTHRLISIIVAVVVVIVCLLITLMSTRRRKKEPLEELSQKDISTTRSVEVDEIHLHLKRTASLLSRAMPNHLGFGVDLPWYLIFGAPGAGKTTVLNNSGLKFPFGDRIEARTALSDGGTHHCNCWVAEEAVLIDTPGCYTVQQTSDAKFGSEWGGLLKLLKKRRRSQPINGALITVSIADIINLDREEMRRQLRTLRQRTSELESSLKARIPVYILLTKADLIVGFAEFFGSFSHPNEDQVWGMTFSLDDSQNNGALTERFTEEFAFLQERIDERLLEHLQRQPDIETRGKIFRFPAEVANLRDRFLEVVEELSSCSQLMGCPHIRGIYLVSGMQTPPSAPLRERRSYFLRELFRSVVFREAALVLRDKSLLRRQFLIRHSSFALLGCVCAALTAGWVSTYKLNINALSEAEARIDSYARLVQGIAVQNVNDTDFLRVLPALDSLRSVTSGFSKRPLLYSSLGLSQQPKIEAVQQMAYRNALNSLLLPRLLVQLQHQLDSERDASSIFDALKFYGMLGGLGPVEPDFVVEQADQIFMSLYPSETRGSLRNSLINHVENLVAGTMDPISLDEDRIRMAREQIKSLEISARAFSLLVNRSDAHRLPTWKPITPLGLVGSHVFERRSHRSWHEGVAGIYTQQGYNQVVRPHLRDAAQQALGEGWVRGTNLTQENPTIDSVANTVLQQYYDMFYKQWHDIVADISIRKPETFTDAAEITRILANRSGPLQSLVQSIVSTTDLQNYSLGSDGVPISQSSQMLSFEAPEVPDLFESLRAALKKPETDPNAQETDQINVGSQFSTILPLLQVLYGQLSRAATATAEIAQIFNAESQLNQANQALVEKARELPSPLDSWVAELSSDITTLAIDTARIGIRDQWRANHRQLCLNIVEGRYPFNRKSQRDVALSDFTRLFGPSGVLKTFFDERIAPFVDTNTSPWRWRGTFGADGHLSQAISQFENADRIRRAFFPPGSEYPEINIDIRPVSLSYSANAVILEIEGERVVYFHGPIQGRSIVWPSKQSTNLSRVAFHPGGWQQALSVNGDWSPFHLFDQAALSNEEGNRFRAKFKNNLFDALFDVQFGSVLNPFQLKALNDFSCPEQF